jgi:DNA (cytosine-5)-methyltransferase 1
MKFISLFSGIGGIDLGLERAGMECVAQVEANPFCRKVLAKHWPEVPHHEDVRNVGRDNLPTAELIAGGFPCQDISYAGDGAGIDGERSGLWREFHRIICELRPEYVLVENVAALLERGISRVLGDLAASGYDCQWDCIPAAAVGAPHRRDRVFVVAHVGQERTKRYFQKPLSRVKEFSWCENVRRVEDLRNRPDLPAPLFRGTRDGIPDWVDRVGACGNAVVPQIAEYIGREILNHSAQQNTATDRFRATRSSGG